MQLTPEILQFADGREVKTEQDWRKRREEILDLFSKYEFGYTPEKKGETTYHIREVIECCNAGHAIHEKWTVTFPTDSGDFSFPVNYLHPKGKDKHLTFIVINFRPDVYDMYIPVTEILDRGYGIAQFCYEDVASDSGDMGEIACRFNRRNDGTDWGKIGMWAYAASRIADVLLNLKETQALAVIGHSRLGKTALWCGAQDERISFVFANGSGCSGAAYERIKHEGSEPLESIISTYPYWFCKNYRQFAEEPDKRPFDQHMLLSLIAPRYLGIGDANMDAWADQYSEQLSCMDSGRVWEKIYNKDGYIGKSEPAETGDAFNGGNVHFHMRDGVHYFGRADWLAYMDFIDEKLK